MLGAFGDGSALRIAQNSRLYPTDCPSCLASGAATVSSVAVGQTRVRPGRKGWRGEDRRYPVAQHIFAGDHSMYSYTTGWKYPERYLKYRVAVGFSSLERRQVPVKNVNLLCGGG